MKKYKVIALSVKGIGSRIYDSGDIVNESNFNEDHPDILVKKGFLELLDESDNLSAEKEAPEKAAAEAAEKEIAEKAAAESAEKEIAEKAATESAEKKNKNNKGK